MHLTNWTAPVWCGTTTAHNVDQDPNASYVDLNRSGVGLMEIVSDPDMRSPEEAAAYVRKLRTIVRYARVARSNHVTTCLHAPAYTFVSHAHALVVLHCVPALAPSCHTVRKATRACSACT